MFVNYKEMSYKQNFLYGKTAEGHYKSDQALTSQALASLYVVRQYIASSIGKWPLEGLIGTCKYYYILVQNFKLVIYLFLISPF